MKLPRGKTKEVFFLEEPHLARFWTLDNRGSAGDCIWYMGFIFLTGMDYPDMLRYLADPAAYDRVIDGRSYIRINRSKKPHKLCMIPVFEPLPTLLTFRPSGEIPSADEINNYMKGVETIVGFPERLTCKVGRKTAGYIFYHIHDYTIEVVSRIMGHSSVSVTERYYVKVTEQKVIQATNRKG
jgi:hypothetical protein